MDKISCSSIDRRDFIKLVGAGAALVALNGCKSKDASSVAQTGASFDKMTYRIDPKNGNNVSLLGYGCMRLPRVPRAHKESLADVNDIDQETVNELTDYAIEHGVNFFDTAPVYCKGFSEHAMGMALSRHPRNKYFISTKLSNQRGDNSWENSLNIYKRSFEALKTDYIDYYLLHSIGTLENFKKRYLDNGLLDFLMKERNAGRIRSLGWSFHGEGEFFDYLMDKYQWDFVLIQLNYLDWNQVFGRATVSAKHQYDVLVEKNVPAMIMEPLLGGRLAMPHYKARAMMAQFDPQASAASWAFRFAGSLPNVLTVLSGMTFMEHLQDNIRAYSPLVPLVEKEYAMLEQAAQIALEYRNINCTTCQYCMPCPYGLDIPGIISHFNRSLNEGNFPDDKQDADYRRARRAFLVGFDRNVSNMRQANRCTGCGICVKDCPQRIDIPQEMRRIDSFTENLKIDV